MVTKRDFATFYGGKEIESLCGTGSKTEERFNLNFRSRPQITELSLLFVLGTQRTTISYIEP